MEHLTLGLNLYSSFQVQLGLVIMSSFARPLWGQPLSSPHFWATVIKTKSPRLSQGLYSCTKHHDQEASWGEKGLFSLHFHTAVHHQRTSGQELTQGSNLEAEADAETTEMSCLLGCFPWFAQLALL